MTFWVLPLIPLPFLISQDYYFFTLLTQLPYMDFEIVFEWRRGDGERMPLERRNVCTLKQKVLTYKTEKGNHRTLKKKRENFFFFFLRFHFSCLFFHSLVFLLLSCFCFVFFRSLVFSSHLISSSSVLVFFLSLLFASSASSHSLHSLPARKLNLLGLRKTRYKTLPGCSFIDTSDKSSEVPT